MLSYLYTNILSSNIIIYENISFNEHETTNLFLNYFSKVYSTNWNYFNVGKLGISTIYIVIFSVYDVFCGVSDLCYI